MSFISAGNTTTTTLVVNGDTTGNLVFNTGGANTTALTISNTQGANFVGSVSALNTFGFKNRIINGNMVVAQYGTGPTSATVTNARTYVCCDRWAYQCGAASKFTVAQSTTAPAGFINSLIVTSSAATSLGSSDYYTLVQPIEGLNVADLAWGTASAKTVTLSFWVQSSLTGTFGGSLENGAANYSYPFSYSIPTANTWTQISITITGPTAGTWTTTNAAGIYVWFGLGVGSTLSGTAGSWSANNYLSATGATSVVGTSGATFYITGTQFEVGSQATSFDFRDYGRELILCQRYFISATNNTLVANAANAYVSAQFPVTMRSAPTVTCSPAISGSGTSPNGFLGYFGGQTGVSFTAAIEL